MKSRCLMWVFACWLVCAVPLFAANEPTANNSVDLARASEYSSAPSGQVLLAANQLTALPDAPQAALAQVLPRLDSALSLGGKQQAPAPPIREGYDRKVVDKKFLVVTGLLVGSTVTDIELIMRCRASGACSAVPSSIAQRSKLYPIGIGGDGAVTLLGYYLKSHRQRWWAVPAAILITGNVIYSVHAAKYIK